MLEQMFLQGKIHAKDRMMAKDMHVRLKEFADNGELEQDEVPKVSTIQRWISQYHKTFLDQATRTALQSNLGEDISEGRLILAVVFFKLSRRTKLNEPPLVYYRFPIIGHTWSFVTDCEKLMLESREKYGETFSLYVLGQVMTVVGKETTHEVLKKDQDFNFNEGFRTLVPFHSVFSHLTSLDKNHKIIRDYVVGKLKYLTSRLQKNIIKAIDLYIGECVEPKVIRDPPKTLSDIIAIPIANIIVGEDCCNYEDILETFKTLTHSVMKIFFVPPILSFIHPWLHKQFVTIPLRFGWNPISNHRKLIISRIKPIIEKRLYDKKRLGDAWIAPLDALQCYLDDPETTPDLDPNNVNYNYIADAIGHFIVAAMATTSDSATQNKQQYWQELYQEAQNINNQYDGNELTSNDIARMVKLDNFVKESLRLSIGVVGLPHKCISKSYYTFANEYQVPSDRIVILNFSDTNNDEELQGPNPTEFNAYRHLERNSPASKLERNFLTFGGGKHACPGRFLAVDGIKVFLHKVILKYDIRTETKGTENIETKKVYFGPLPGPIKGGIVFENRKEIAN
ncbi:2263_t:CDS:10 [Scutellospora calospora]|uniref:2263_t:CDS:1 n=1 Tax=Scutellospora calospora TaxID=85575 RepID=A0ACA9KX84_9GLOM|nr:2263_t:CDS:10 [Scutellospora calospora]